VIVRVLRGRPCACCPCCGRYRRSARGGSNRLSWKFCRSSIVSNHHVGLHPSERTRSGTAPERMRKACSPWRGTDGRGDGCLGRHVADGPREPLDQEVDERLEVVPVLVALGVEDDVCVSRRRKLLEAPVALPSPATSSLGLSRRPMPSPARATCPLRRLLPRKKPTSRYQNISPRRPGHTPRRHADSSAEMSMLPGSGIEVGVRGRRDRQTGQEDEHDPKSSTHVAFLSRTCRRRLRP